MASYTPVKLAYIAVEPEVGVGCKTPIILAHGMSGCKEQWDDIIQTIANGTKSKVYAIDARNHGDSEWTDELNFECNVDDILHFMDTEGIPKAIIIGHSMGGYTGMMTAIRAPERVEKLIVEDMSVKSPPSEVFGPGANLITLYRHAVQQLPNDVDEATAEKLILEFVISQISEDFKSIIKPESFKHFKMQLKRTEDGHYSYKNNMKIMEKALLNPSEMATDVEGVYEGPAFFVYGKLSPFQVGLNEQIIKEHFPNAEFAGIENATHGVHFDCPIEFTEAILNYILKE